MALPCFTTWFASWKRFHFPYSRTNNPQRQFKVTLICTGNAASFRFCQRITACPSCSSRSVCFTHPLEQTLNIFFTIRDNVCFTWPSALANHPWQCTQHRTRSRQVEPRGSAARCLFHSTLHSNLILLLVSIPLTQGRKAAQWTRFYCRQC